ncbi:hypothetical protein BKK52_11170 [Rodentibacter trehalosifermentans]|uniref:Uncharacterized protein n=1 Tax=Rodentibacter trehalosifermentans TaxID=1908263 RepID=A0A1V3IWF6_9PAST|nr:hypothetical protein [Rodentibacter trehalosifermentans]OOF46635.1 hypothetical protein BKK52_11170 [Rodentibacter trehalosifermentans]
MKLIILLFSTFLLNGCFLFMHKCDSLTGWCSSSNSPSLHEYDSWYSSIEVDNLKRNSILTLPYKIIEVENNKKKDILESCGIEPYDGSLIKGSSLENARICVYKKGLCSSRKGVYSCNFSQ